MSDKKTVFVGLSGGVDSSVSALRLKADGFNVVGVFIKVWHPDFLECNWEAERLDAMRVAAHLDIPFLMCDAEEAYKHKVADYFIEEYKAGRTPNPDVMCNKEVKFGVFMDFAFSNGADFIATGHYVIKEDRGGVSVMKRGIDTNKDQSYFLWTIKQEQLTKVLFPIGNTPKDKVRKEARRAGIPVATKDDSQGICFLGHVDIPDFLSHFIDLREGNVLNSDGEIIGTHRGAFVYTLGQRHGFTISENQTNQIPHYIVKKNIDDNTITVSTKKPKSKKGSDIQLHSLNFISKPPAIGDEITVQTRYRQTPSAVKVTTITEDNMVLTAMEQQETPTTGQSCVLYNDDVCLGGGIIS